MIVKPLVNLNSKELDTILELDKKSGFSVYHWVKDNTDDYAYGIYNDNNEIVGYCTIGGADAVNPLVEEIPNFDFEDYYLSDVYVKPEYRHKGYGTYMLKEAIKIKYRSEGIAPIYLEVLYNDLKNFYNLVGFKTYKDTYVMMYN